MNITIDKATITISVNVTSNPPLSYIRWFRNGVQMFTGVSVTERSIQILIRGIVVTTQGYRINLSISNYDDDTFGSYKMIAANTKGVSEHYIQVDNPNTGKEFLDIEIRILQLRTR